MKHRSTLIALAGLAGLGVCAAYALTYPVAPNTEANTAVAVVSGASSLTDSILYPSTPNPTGDPLPPAAPPGVTLQEAVYFGTCWQFIQRLATDPPIVLGGGWTNANVIRSVDGIAFAGTVEKRDASGAVTDVVLMYAGAETPNDHANGILVLLNVPSEQAEAARRIFEQVRSDPRYASARLHVVGHSLGAGLTQYVLGYSLATYGKQETDRRGDFIEFGVPPWGTGVLEHFGLQQADFDGRIVGYTAENDPTLKLGFLQLGFQHLLRAYQPWGDSVAVAQLNGVTAHLPPTYIGAIGLPDWLTGADRDAMVQKTKDGVPGLRYDPNYGPPGTVSETQLGDGAANSLVGSSSADRLIGRGGADRLTGGGGADTFVYESVSDSPPTATDVITDFSDAGRIDLCALAAGGQSLIFVGSGSFSGADQVRTYYSGADTYVAVNIDADLRPDLLIRVNGRHTIGTGQLVLVPPASRSGLAGLPVG